MIGIAFDKSRTTHFLDCLATGKPIDPQSEGWNGHDLLALAGACLFARMSHGPDTHAAGTMATLHAERREAIEDTLLSDLHVAIEFYSHLTMLVNDGEYDNQFAPNVQAVVSSDGDEKIVNIVDGALDA